MLADVETWGKVRGDGEMDVMVAKYDLAACLKALRWSLYQRRSTSAYSVALSSNH